VSGVIEDLDLLLRDFREKIAEAARDYLDAGEGGTADERLERLVYGRFLDPEARRSFFEAFKEIEALWEILSPSPELRDHIDTYKRLTQLYAAVRNAYAEKIGFVADLAYKTQRLIQEAATQEGLGRLTKSVTFDVKTLESLRGEKGPDGGKVFNLVRGLQKEMDEDADAAAVLQPLKDRAERILKDLEDRKTTGLAAMDLLAGLAAEKEQAMKSAKASGLTARVFAAFWSLREDAALKTAAVDPMVVAQEVEKLSARFPNAVVNPEEKRRLRAALYQPLLKLGREDRARVVEVIMAYLVPEEQA
jgi:type I restriction enzyme R subunit